MASDVKWIKIATDIFDDEKIAIIEAMPDADVMIVLWFKILTLAGKVNTSGVLMINDRIPYTDEMLATIFRRKISQVKMALEVFQSLDMIEIINGVVTIPNWGKHQKLDAIESKREYQKEYMREYRDKQKQLALKEPCKTNSKANGETNVRHLDNTSNSNSNSSSTSSKKTKESKQDYFLDERLNAKFEDYLNMRVSIKKKATTQAIKLAVSKLQELGNNDVETMIQILEQSILNSWQGLFPLKQDPKKVTKTINDRW